MKWTRVLLAGAALLASCASGGRGSWEDATFAQPDTGYWLFVMTHSPPLDFRSLERLTTSMRKNARGKQDGTIGHAWLKIVGPQESRECGHTGDEGYRVESYEHGLARRLREGAPDPVGYFWQPLDDGSMQVGSGGFEPTLVAARALTRDEFDRIAAYIAAYDFRCYALRGPQCTTFVLGALAEIGICIDANLRIPVAQWQSFGGKRLRFWTDPAFSTLDIPVPQVLEARLRDAIGRGEFGDVTAQYPSVPR